MPHIITALVIAVIAIVGYAAWGDPINWSVVGIGAVLAGVVSVALEPRHR